MLKGNKLVRIVAAVVLTVIGILSGCGDTANRVLFGVETVSVGKAPKPGTNEYAKYLHDVELNKTLKQIRGKKYFSKEEQNDPIFREAKGIIKRNQDRFWWGEVGSAVIESKKKPSKITATKDTIYLKNGETLSGKILGIDDNYIYIATGEDFKHYQAINKENLSSYLDN